MSKTGPTLHKEILKHTVKNGVEEAVIWEFTMVKYAYLNFLKINMKQRAVEFGLESDSYFLKDINPKHTEDIVKP